jgi:hypothetical protein
MKKKQRRGMTDDEFADWVESPEGKAEIAEAYERAKNAGSSRAKGKASVMLEAAGLMRRSPGVPISIRVSPEDLNKAREIARRKGLGYQTYLKMVLHEALEREAR